MFMQHRMGFSVRKDLPDCALLAILIARTVGLMRYLVAVTADDLVTGEACLAAVGLVGGQDAVGPGQ